MPIKIRRSPEPLSEQSFRLAPDEKCLLVESDAARLLKLELQRYCDQEIAGRSFLIAGHRGAGKTTLVANAFFEVWRDSLYNRTELRPLFVRLHGPNLLPDPRRSAPPRSTQIADTSGDDDADTADANDEATDTIDGDADDEEKDEVDEQDEAEGKGAEESPGKKPAKVSSESGDRDFEMREALKQITLGLHRAVASEIATAFQGSVDDAFPERLELAAQLEMELYESPRPMRLREFWARGGFLTSGVLRVPSRPSSLPQGLAELVALAGVAEAYRRISGTLTRSEKDKDAARAKLLASLAVDSTGKDLTSPLVALLTGGLVGTGILQSGASGYTATLTGLVAALGAVGVVKLSSSRFRARSIAREDTFLFDLSVATLDRVLPMLIERLRRAGLAPVFVVDELDKVVNLADRMVGMVHHLKKFVAEHAFFCFLTDRSYFEALIQRGREKPYPVEHTYFSHHVFVVHRVQDFHKYLSEVLEIPAPPPAAQPPIPPATTAGTQPPGLVTPAPASTPPGVQPSAPLQSAAPATPPATPHAPTPTAPGLADAADYPVLPFYLLHRSRMHTIDLQRELAALRNDAGYVSLSEGALRTSLAHRLDVTVQVAIEMVLDQDAARFRLERQPNFRRLAYDAMYFMSRRWETGELDVQFDKAGERLFQDYLNSRVGEDLANTASAGHTNGNDKKPRKGQSSSARNGVAGVPAPTAEKVSDSEATFLFELVRRLAIVLASQETYLDALAAWDAHRARVGGEKNRLDAAVKNALALGPKVGDVIQPDEGPPLERFGKDRYRWRYDYAGGRADEARAREPVTVLPPHSVPPAAHTPAAPQFAGEQSVAGGPRTTDQESWMRNLRLIRRFELVLTAPREQTPVEDKDLPEALTGETFKYLSEEWNVIPTTPAALEVRRAVERLLESRSKGRRHGNYDRDAEVVEKFATMLCRNAETLAAALFCDAALTKASAVPGLVHGWGSGMWVIAYAYRFRKKGESEVLEVFRQVGTALRDRFGVLRGTELAIAPVTDEESFDDWATAVRNMLGPVEELLLSTDDMPGIRRGAWGSVKTRVVEFLSHRVSPGTAAPSALPTVDELITAQAGIRPGNLIHVDLDAMTIGHWGNVFQFALLDLAPESEQHCPYWMAIAAAWAVGFPPHPLVLSHMVDVQPHYRKRPHEEFSEVANDAMAGLWKSSVAPLIAAVLIKRPSKSLVEGWAPDPRFAVMPLALSEISKIPQHVWDLLPSPEPLIAIVEMPADMDKVGEALPRFGAYIRLLAREPKRGVERLPSDIIAPRNVADLFPSFRQMTR